MRRIGPILVLIGLAGLARADGFIVIRDLPRPAPAMPLEVRTHHVSVHVKGRVAVTEVDQVFYNPGDARLEGTYLFPMPKGSQIDRFSMDVNGKMTAAELLDAAKARQIYEEIVRKARDPALLEYVGQGLFKARIFPIEPRSEKRVQLSYTQLLKEEGGLVEYLYPLNTEKFSARPLRSVSVKVDVELPEGIRSVYSPSHEVEVKRHGATRAVAGFEAKEVRPDTDFQLFIAPKAGGDVGLSALAFRDASDPEGTFLLMISPSAEMAAEKVAQKDVVFVLDTSGSMAEGKKLEQARKALSFCLKNLNAGDRFELVRFSTEAEPLFGRLVAASAPNLEKAEAFLASLKPIGGTAIEEALVRALEPLETRGERERPYVVVFLTDGKPTIGATNDEAILRKLDRAMGDRTIRVFSLGIGTDVNTHLLDGLSERTRGASQYVLPNEDLELKLSSFYSKISQPVLSNPKLTFKGPIRTTKLAPPELPDLFKGEQLIVLGRYTGAGRTAVTLSGTVNGVARSFTYETSLPEQAKEHGFVPRLWATRRIGFLLDQIRLHGESAELREEVTLLARQHGIVTPYTAYLIVEDETRRNVPVISRTFQNVERDRALRLSAEGIYKSAKEEKSGDAAVGGAQALDALKNAQNAAAASTSNAYAFRAPSAAEKPGGTKVEQLVQGQATRSIRGRTFYQNGNLWVDARVQAQKGASTVKVKFDSKEYYGLLAKHDDVAPWLSVGRNVQLVLEGTIYEVVD